MFLSKTEDISYIQVESRVKFAVDKYKKEKYQRKLKTLF